MAQIPALFLPTGSTHNKVKPVEKILKEKIKTFNKQLPALLQGRVDGNKKDNRKVRSRGT